MPAPLPSEFAALVPSGATDVKDTSQATGAEIRKILLGTGSDDSLAHLMAKWMENWFDEDGAIIDPLKSILCDQECVQDAQTPPSGPTTTVSTTSTTTAAPTTTTPAPGATTTTTTSTTTAWPAQSRTFSSAIAGSKITWSNLPAGTYVVRYTGGYYEINAGVTTYYASVQGVTDGVSPLGGLLSGTEPEATQAGNNYNDGTPPSTPSNPRVYTVGQGGSVELEIQWMTPGTATMRSLTFTLSKQ